MVAGQGVKVGGGEGRRGEGRGGEGSGAWISYVEGQQNRDNGRRRISYVSFVDQ